MIKRITLIILISIAFICSAESPRKDIYMAEYTCAEFVIGKAGECDKEVIKVCFEGDSLFVDMSTKENFVNSVCAGSFLYADDYPAVKGLYVSLFGNSGQVEQKFQKIYYLRYLSWENMAKTGSGRLKLATGDEVCYCFRSYHGLFCKLPLSESRLMFPEDYPYLDNDIDQVKDVVIPFLPVSCRTVSLTLIDARK